MAARIIMLLSGLIIAIIAIPAYFLLCLWIAAAEAILKKGDKKNDRRQDPTN